MTRPLVLGLDQGTTSTRACLMSDDGQIVARAQAAHRQHYPKPGWVEHDPAEIWERCREVIEGVLQQKPANASIVALGLANQGETIAAWRRSDGAPLGRALVWQDTRCQEWVEEIARDEKTARRVTEKSGLTLDAYFSAGKIRWILDHEKEARVLAAKRDLCVGTLDSWMIRNLTGGKSFLTDHSTAARTLLFNIHDLRYDAWLLELFGIPADILPEARTSTGEFGKVTGFGPDLDGVPILANLVDQPASLFGLGCHTKGQVKATYGTGCFIYMNCGEHAPESRNGLLSTVAWTRSQEKTVEKAYALDGGIFSAGSAVTWLRDQVGLIASENELDTLAGSVADSGGVTCVPALAGLAAPYWARGAKALWLGMGLHSSRGHLVRSALEGIAFRVAQVVNAMEKDSGLRIHSLLVDGGLTRSAVLMQAQADALGIPVEVCEDADHTVAGAALLAGLEAGVWKNAAEIPWKPHVLQKFTPRWKPEERESRLRLFDAAARMAREWPPTNALRTP